MNTKTKPKMVRIVAAVVDTRNLTLYKENGETIIIPQGDTRVRRILEEATPMLISLGVAEVVIDEADNNSYAKFENEGSGVVKFFRIAKSKLLNLFTQVQEPEPMIVAPVPVTSVGVVPTLHTSVSPQEDDEMDDMLNGWPVMASATPAQDHIATAGVYDVSEADEVAAAVEAASEQSASAPKVTQALVVINEIMTHAIPASSVEFHESGVATQGRIVETSGTTIKAHGAGSESHTIIAVVDNKIIPGMEMIKTQFSRAVKMGSTVGVENFLRRLANVIEQRSHSVEDLLKFLERADLPIADDGSILIYKVLRKLNDKYVDCRSRKVTQFIGAYVCMDVKLVDPNRRNECSNGLHVARRGYIREFIGDVCVLAKLAPEDVIAVPTYDANKMRVCGYHIIAELAPEQYTAVKANKPITGTKAGRQLLAKAIAGDHIHKTHEVRITEQMGGGVVITKLDKPSPVIVTVPPVAVVMEVEALDDQGAEALDQPTDPKDVVKVVEQAMRSRKAQAQALYATWDNAPASEIEAALSALLAFKKAARKGWDVLGIPDPTATTKAKLAVKVKTKKGKGTKVAPPPSVFKAANPTPSMFATTVSIKPPSPVAELILATHGEGSARERVQKLMAIGLTSTGIAAAVFKLKQQSKKSWNVIGVNEVQVAEIMRLKGVV